MEYWRRIEEEEEDKEEGTMEKVDEEKEKKEAEPKPEDEAKEEVEKEDEEVEKEARSESCDLLKLLEDSDDEKEKKKEKEEEDKKKEGARSAGSSGMEGVRWEELIAEVRRNNRERSPFRVRGRYENVLEEERASVTRECPSGEVFWKLSSEEVAWGMREFREKEKEIWQRIQDKYTQTQAHTNTPTHIHTQHVQRT
jgi:hypothetical protein